MRRLVLLPAAALLLACPPEKLCPNTLFPCGLGCVPQNAVCCADGSYCLSPTVCVAAGAGFTCSGDTQNFSCGAGTRHCGLECIPNGARCCRFDDCTDPAETPSGGGICTEQKGFVLCGQCLGSDNSCSGLCRYCGEGSFCGGDICGDVKCCTGKGCSVDTPSDCAADRGSGGAGSCSGNQYSAACPDGSHKCCSTNQVCCHDSANGGAIGCEFSGFCD